jgi:hypothetical protein
MGRMLVRVVGLLLVTGSLSGCISLAWAPCRCEHNDGKSCSDGHACGCADKGTPCPYCGRIRPTEDQQTPPPPVQTAKPEN